MTAPKNLSYYYFGCVLLLLAQSYSQKSSALTAGNEPPAKIQQPLTAASIAPAPPRACPPAKVNEILQDKSAHKADVYVACNLKLHPGDKITKNLLISGTKASNISIDCNGASIDHANILVFSKKIRDRWSRPENITISNCIVNDGYLRVYGMAGNGQGTDYDNAFHDSSRSSTTRDGSDHTQRAQANAPTNIHFEGIKIDSSDAIPVYIAPGVTHTSLSNSEIGGTSNSVAIYLDAESAYNLIQNNYIHTKTGNGRELVAIDGSAENKIVGNHFSSLNNGGIYIYRNCGEGGTIRVQTPQGNKIINNSFYYKKYRGDNPALWVASRNGNRRYCNDDSGFNYGSSINNNDFALGTVVIGNQIINRSSGEVFRFSDPPSRVSGNTDVAETSVGNKESE